MRPACGMCLLMACKCSAMANTRVQSLDRSSGDRDGKNEIRKPKSEGRKKSEIRTPKTAHAYSAFRFRPSFGLRPSDFGLLLVAVSPAVRARLRPKLAHAPDPRPR